MEIPSTYETAYAELQEIVAALENETISVDELALKVKRATQLVEFCQSKLKSAETEVNKIIKNQD
ncbi:exodeoxyribonuclease VII small subunit [Flavihumibacter sp. CACIAM 22H1]|uniref:exodeoxyribonuclease VII small subunit n=1 Tax=Flavihumibacter sp. CACIAM 22H1 TaxID=1812911 RepID=UPI0007A914A6|nr:exodeoxyribonuclease VII small subunit [Flavihumibacter sp. CACIAM 22H1]KYP13920.1 MAG: exonuclease VII small subunit [Flavihumibacter sp. CACIAM 22H1]